MANIGIVGGTFDPIHNGHILLGEQAYREYQLDEIWYMPSGQPPHKRDHHVTAGSIRLELTRLAIKGRAGFCCSDFEIRRSGTTYTAQTLSLLHQQYPGNVFYFIIGADSLYEMEHWYTPELVMKQAVLLVAGREYGKSQRSVDQQILYLKGKYECDIRRPHCPEMLVSSAMLRKMAAQGESIEAYVPHSVYEYIVTHHLYQETEDEGSNSKTTKKSEGKIKSVQI